MKKKPKYIDITPGVCGYNSHANVLVGPEEGIAQIGKQWYSWYGGCPICVDMKLKELEELHGGK